MTDEKVTATSRETDPTAVLEPFLGEWTVAPPGMLAGAGGRVTFERLGKLVVERGTVPIPDAPDGVAVIRVDPQSGGFLQHYFDERGIARVYQMQFSDGVWTLSRITADVTPLDFKQRWRGTFREDGRVIEGAWEICHDDQTWQKDFDLRYERVGQRSPA